MSKQQNEIIPPEGTKLYVDIGNSSLKAAYQQDAVWHNPHPHPSYPGSHTASDFVDWINLNYERIDLVVITSVVEEVTDALTQQLKENKYRILTIDDIPNELIDYKTPETLGLDRFFGCYGAVTHTRKSAVVIDAGSACTVDFMASDFLYRGGVIMPGLKIIEEGVRKKLPALPYAERKLPDEWPGKSSRESLQWGVTGSYIFAIERMLKMYEEEFGEFDLVITGGSAEQVADLLNPADAKVRPSLVFEGMKKFLEDYL